MSWTYTAAVSPVVNFSDANLAQAVRFELGIAPGTPLNQAQLASLTVLTAPSESIGSLQGLQYATNLTSRQLITGNPSVANSQMAQTTFLTSIAGLPHPNKLVLQNVGLAAGFVM